jgi:hypothetical protein
MIMASVIDRITINNILAVILIATYAGMWAFTLFSAVTDIIPEGETRMAVGLDALESMSSILGTMTIIVILVVQYHFRKAQETPVV